MVSSIGKGLGVHDHQQVEIFRMRVKDATRDLGLTTDATIRATIVGISSQAAERMDETHQLANAMYFCETEPLQDVEVISRGQAEPLADDAPVFFDPAFPFPAHRGIFTLRNALINVNGIIQLTADEKTRTEYVKQAD